MKRRLTSRYFLCHFFIIVTLSISSFFNISEAQNQPIPNLITNRSIGRTSFQQAGQYDPKYDLKTDLVMVYGVSDATIASLPEWRERSGSHIAVMTGIAWGAYNEYLDGTFDGVNHWDDAQVNATGNRILHDPSTPYLVPSIAFTSYLESRLKKVIDAGIDEIYLEEPELWGAAGFGDSFKREWQMYYKTEAPRPDASCDSQYLASKLKLYLYRRAIDRVVSALKEYSLKIYSRPLKVYVATHSLVSYAQIQMLSPESSLLDLPHIDGVIAQTWTGTSRFSNLYNGIQAERTFETALLEYGCMQEMTRGTNKRLYFLNDPVEDDPRHNWQDYQTNYLCTLVASLMRSETEFYEVAPWPSRVFLDSFPAGSPNAQTIPNAYASTLTLVFQQLRDMGNQESQWCYIDHNNQIVPNTKQELMGKMGVLLADSVMFQRSNPTVTETAVDNTDDPLKPTPYEISTLGDLMGLTMPLIKNGLPVEIPILDNVMRFPGYLDNYKLLVLSYDYQKPSSPGIHSVLANWVVRGGTLVFIDSRQDPYNTVREWWNQSQITFETPGDHLLMSLGLEPNQKPGKYHIGSGWVILERKRPAFYNRSVANANEYRNLITNAANDIGLAFNERNYILKRRGPYILAAVLTESCADIPLEIRGRFVNLFDPELKVTETVTIFPSERTWLLDLDRISSHSPLVLASSCRIESLKQVDNVITIDTTTTENINAITLLKLNANPKRITINGNAPDIQRWDSDSQTLFFRFKTQEKANIVLEY